MNLEKLLQLDLSNLRLKYAFKSQNKEYNKNTLEIFSLITIFVYSVSWHYSAHLTWS